MKRVNSSRPPATHQSIVGRYAYLSQMVGMAVSYGPKSTRGKIMGCWTSNPGEPQFAVMGSDGRIKIVDITKVKFYLGKEAVQQAFADADATIIAREARLQLEREREAKQTSKPKRVNVADDEFNICGGP